MRSEFPSGSRVVRIGAGQRLHDVSESTSSVTFTSSLRFEAGNPKYMPPDNALQTKLTHHLGYQNLKDK